MSSLLGGSAGMEVSKQRVKNKASDFIALGLNVGYNKAPSTFRPSIRMDCDMLTCNKPLHPPTRTLAHRDLESGGEFVQIMMA